jgi:PilZ domain
MAVNVNVAVSPVDLSVSGACFFAERPFSPGARIDLSVASVFTVQAEVVDCEMEESGEEFLEVHYRVRCRFVDEEAGLEMLVLTKEREDLP